MAKPRTHYHRPQPTWVAREAAQIENPVACGEELSTRATLSHRLEDVTCKECLYWLRGWNAALRGISGLLEEIAPKA